MNRFQRYIFNDDKIAFSKFSPFLQGRILKVGNGLGYLSSFIKEKHSDLVVIDIHKGHNSENKDEVIIYNGKRFPFEEKTFDCVVCSYILHHTPNPLQILDEMERVGRRFIILEETYRNIFSKLCLIYRDIYINILAGQRVKIFWNSYFTDSNIKKAFSDRGLSIIHQEKTPRGNYCKNIFVVEKR